MLADHKATRVNIEPSERIQVVTEETDRQKANCKRSFQGELEFDSEKQELSKKVLLI